MTTFGFNHNYLMKDEKPWFPIMGEMHYSRYPKRFWKESLYKMKAGDLDIVSSYVLWIHHEEVEGEYDFEGDKDLRAFVEEVKGTGLYMMLRIGPWCHAEARNGGFPDWILARDYEPRTNDEDYFDDVSRFYRKIFEQVEGLFLKDGGPIIGVQIENEYGHCGGLTGIEGENHMKRLYEMALDIGYDVPFYTATGWGGAVTGGLLPVMGGYSDAPWDQRTTQIEPSGNFIFTHERNDHNIGSDHGFGEGITFDIEKFPYLTAELGGGLQVTHHRRPVSTAEDIGAMSLAKLGSGVNLLGYYMYHGGTNPEGKKSTLQESRETGSLNDLPQLSYDFRAPIREYGQITETYKEIKLLAMFIKDFGEDFCKMEADIPEENPLNPANSTDLRLSYRHNETSGYVFVNNYQRNQEMTDHKNVVLEVNVQEKIVFPSVDVSNREYFFYPFNMRIGDAVLQSACVTPLCKLNMESEQNRAIVFYGDKEPNYSLEGELDQIELLTLSREDAQNAWKVCLDKEYLIISNGAILSTEKGIECIGTDTMTLKVFPELTFHPEGFEEIRKEDQFTVYEKRIRSEKAGVKVQLDREEDGQNIYTLSLDMPEEVNDYFLSLEYAGDRMKLFIEGEFVADDFYAANDLRISMRRFDFPKKLCLEIYELKEKDDIYLEKWPEMEQGRALALINALLEPEYRQVLYNI